MAHPQTLSTDMEAIFHSYGGILNLPLPNDKRWGANITKWLDRGLSLDFIERVATKIEGQHWNSNRKVKASSLGWEYHEETRWRLEMDRKLKSLKYRIVFGDSNSQEWEAAVVKCFELGFNVAFVEELECRQKPDECWTPSLRNKAKNLEWQFYRPILTEKYTVEGKSLAQVVAWMLSEKGIKLSRDTLWARFREWGVDKGTKSHAIFASQSMVLSTPALTKSTSSATSNITLPDQARTYYEESSVKPLTLSSKGGFSCGIASQGDTANSGPWVPVDLFKDTAATSNRGEGAIFIGEDQSITAGYYEGQLDSSGELFGNSSSAQIVPSRGHSDHSEMYIGVEQPIAHPFNSPLDWPVYVDDPRIQFLPSNYPCVSSHLGPSIGTKSPADMSTQLPTQSAPSFGSFIITNPSNNNLEKIPDPKRLASDLPAEEIETGIPDLSAAIKAKEEELRGIRGNHNAVARELDELRSQHDLVSFDPRSLTSITRRNQPESYHC